MFNRFLEVAKEGKNDWWRYLITIGVSILTAQIPSVIWMLVMTGTGRLQANDPQMEAHVFDAAYLGVSHVAIQLVQIGSFVFATLGLWLCVKFVHRKRFLSIITASKNLRIRRIGFGFVSFLAIMFATLTVQKQADPTNFDVIFQLKPFLISLLIALFLLPIQTWWEEFLIRGVMLQGIGLITGKALIPVLVTAGIFGALHMNNPEVHQYGWQIMLPIYTLPGLVFGVITALDEGSELAMGAHWANNLFLTSVVTNSSFAIQAPAYYNMKNLDPQTELWVSALQYLIFISIMWATYKWKPAKLYQ